MPVSKIPTVSSEQMKLIDSFCVEFGVSVEQLMENAGARVSELAEKMLGKVEGKTIIVLVGSGNKGGDGLVAARLLEQKKAKVKIILSSAVEEMKELPRKQLEKLKKTGKHARVHEIESMKQFEDAEGLLNKCDLIIDALLGFGLASAPRGLKAELIEKANDAKTKKNIPILSIDIPSGLDSDTGKAYAPCIRATTTITLGLPKTGLMNEDVRQFGGKLFLADIGIPEKAFEKIELKVGKIFEKKRIIELM